jgi:uncharacterized paraquat-inducible protein A
MAGGRIIDGIRELFKAGLAPLGALIFFTSIAIPVLKIAGLGWWVLSVRRKSRKHLVGRQRIFTGNSYPGISRCTSE